MAGKALWMVAFLTRPWVPELFGVLAWTALPVSLIGWAMFLWTLVRAIAIAMTSRGSEL